MKKLFLLSTVLLTVAFTSCTKEETNKEEETVSNESATGCDYMTYEVGTETVFDQQGVIETTVFTEEVTIDGTKWLKGITDEGESSERVGYMRCDNSYFYTRSTVNGETILFRPMKIDGVVNSEWVDEVSISGSDIKYTHTIVALNGSRTVEGNAYSDVAEVEIVASTIVDGMEFPYSEYTEYFSKSSGFIESTLEQGTTLISRKN